MRILGRCAKIEIDSIQTNVAIMQGALPYNMAIAMMNASPIVIVALKEGRNRKSGTVRIARIVNTIQPLYGVVANSHPAQITMGKARHATVATYTLSLNGNSPQVITPYQA